MAETLVIKVNIDGSGAVTGAVEVERAVERAGRKSKNSLSQAGKEAQLFQRSIDNARNSVLGLVGAAALVQTARGLANMADEYANVGAQLKLASDGTVSFTEAQRDALGVAQRTASELSTTAELVGKLSTAFRSLGGEARTSFGAAVILAETISQGVALSGAGAAAANAAITQLGQGLASGTLRGDELNSVLEQTPRLAQAIAAGMGKTVGQLRALGAEGKITALQIVEALKSQRDQLSDEFSQLPLTISRAWTSLHNAVLSYVGQADQASGASAHLAQQIAGIADHLDDIARAAVLMGGIVAAVYAGKLINSGIAWIGNLAAQSVAVDELGVKTQLSLAQTVKNVGLLRTSVNLLGTAVVGWQIGSYLYDQFAIVRQAGAAAIGTLIILWERLKESGALAWLSLQEMAINAAAAMQRAFLGFLDGVARALQGSMLPQFRQVGQQLAASVADGLAKAGEKVEAQLTRIAVERLKVRAQSDAAVQAATANVLDYWDAENKAGSATEATTDSTAAQNRVLDELIAQLKKSATEQKKKTAVDKAAAAQMRALTSATLAYAEKTRDLEDATADARAKLDGLTDAQLTYRRGIRDAIDGYNELIAKGRSVEASNQFLAQRVGALNDQLQVNTDTANAAAAAAANLGDVQRTQTSAAERYYQVLADGARNVADTIAGVFVNSIRSASDLWRGLVDVSRSIVQQIISTWLQLRVLQPMLASIFGGRYGGGGYGAALGAVGQAFGLGGTSTGGGGAGGGAGADLGTYLQAGNTLYKGYNWLFGGTAAAGAGGAAATTAAGNMGAAYGAQLGGAAFPGMAPATGFTTGTVGGLAPAGSYYGGGFSAGGYAAPYASVGGGLLGAYYGSKQGGGGLSTVASTVSYGALGAGIAGTAAGVAGGMSVGTAAAGAYGAIAGASWIPVVGWILAALAVVDAVSGGKLFGTKYRPTSAATSLNLSAAGATAEQFVTEQKQRALFGGRKVRTREVAASAEVQQAAQKLYDGVRKSMVQGAQQLSADVPDMINASLRIESKLNDKGQVKSTKYLVEYLGKTWEEATADAATQRIGAEALVATVAASAGAVAQRLAEQWRDSAETLADGAATMLAAQTDIVRGNQLLAVGAHGTLSDVIDLVEQMQVAGQTLQQTYQQLAQANAQYLQFVAQFDKAAAGSGLGAVLGQISAAMHQDIDQANALARAAGLQGAREEDLANIHTAAAQQAAEAIRQLTGAADQLASKLYAATGNTLAAVNAQIDALQGKVQSAAQLALGDLSPLSDQEKLDLALKGLRSGTTSAQDVLSLGQRLYATGSDYRGLYDKVQSILGLPSATGAGEGSLDDQLGRLNTLTQQRDHLQSVADAAQRVTDAKALASYVADLSTVRGQGFGDVAQSLGFSLSDLAKDLGVSNISSYLKQLQDEDIPGSLGEASTEIVDAIRDMGRDIVQAITGGPVTPVGPTPGVSAQQGVYMSAQQLQDIQATLKSIEKHTGSTADDTRQVARNGKVEQLRLAQDRRLPPVSTL